MSSLVLSSFEDYLKSHFFSTLQDPLAYALEKLSEAAIEVSSLLGKSSMLGIGHEVGTVNLHGDVQKELDLITNEIFIRAISDSGVFAAVVSEENDDFISLDGKETAPYLICIDPLDGSDNSNVNVPVGTIFSIYERKTSIGQPVSVEDFLQPGRLQKIAGYFLYGFSTMFVLSGGEGVDGFTLDRDEGQFYRTHPDMKCIDQVTMYSINESILGDTPDWVQKYIASLRGEVRTRYVGSLVSDFHRNLLKGGVYLYPSTLSRPSGKLRLLYECNPIAFLAEQSGGKATSEVGAILDIQPESIHKSVPFFVGGRTSMEALWSFKNEGI